jgi:nitrite reductase/ring-hydroxylating ferredoxin subunit
MASYSKIRYFFISVTLLIIPVSCEKNKNDVIPDVYVDFTMDISYDIIFKDLASFGNYVYIDYLTNNWGRYSAGYDSSGIIVYRYSENEFNAYDRTCPFDYVTNGRSVRINVDFTEAICPVCSTHYALAAYGSPVSGPGRYPLKNYRTSFDGRYVRVWNYY